MAGHNDPRLLYSIPNIRAYHIQNGDESPLTPSGAQTLSLLMVPTSSPFADLSTVNPQNEAPEEDFYLHLHLPPELDLPLPATTQIYHQPPTSYLIPRWDLGPGSGAFTRIEFPSVGSGSGRVNQEDVDTFETILAQCTAFLERAPPPTSSGYPDEKKGKRYNPAEYGPGEAYAYGGGAQHGRIVLVDEENGSVVGELSEGFNILEDSKLQVGSKDPVEIQLPSDTSNQIGVRPASPEYLQMANHPAYKNSTIVSHAASASRLIVTTTSKLSEAMQSGANNFTAKTKPNANPMTFTPTAQARVRKLHNFSKGAADLSAKTVGQVNKHAQNLGAKMARKGERAPKEGKPADYKPGLLNKSMIAFSTIADGVDHSARSLLQSGSVAATTVVGHKYGSEAAQVAQGLTGSIKHVGLVYVDATGVSRRAVIKSVAKGMVIGRVRGGGEVVVDGGDRPVATVMEARDEKGESNYDLPGAAGPTTGELGFGNAAPPAYGSGVGESLGGSAPQGDVKGYR